jgi:hypothetical protein
MKTLKSQAAKVLLCLWWGAATIHWVDKNNRGWPAFSLGNATGYYPVWDGDSVVGSILFGAALILSWYIATRLLPWLYKTYEINPIYKRHLPFTRRRSERFTK